MKKVLVLWNDRWHPDTAIEEALYKALPKSEWDITTTKNPADLCELPKELDLLIFFSNRSPNSVENGPPPEGTPWRTDEEQIKWLERVKAGMGVMFVHAGLTAYPAGSVIHKDIARAKFIRHPEHCETSFDPIPAMKDHPVMKGVDSFTADDEHYICMVDTDNTLPLAYSTSQHGTAIAAWTHDIGKGRVVCACPAHYKEVFDLPPMIRLMNNMAKYAVKID